MAQALVSMAGLSGSTRLTGFSTSHPLTSRYRCLSVRCQQSDSSRREVLGLLAAGFVSTSLTRESLAAEPRIIKIGPPPPPSGGLSGTGNSDEATDLGLPLKDRFYIQPLPVDKAAERAKDSAKEIVGVKELIEKKQWPYVQNDLRNKAGYLRYDLNKVISSKPIGERKPLKELTGKLFQNITDLDHAAKLKNGTMAEKYYSETVSTLNDVLTQIG